MSFTENQLTRDIDLIKNIFKTNGFYFANVDSSLIKNDELNSVRLKLDVKTGERARITEISFIGDKKIKDKKLRNIIASEEDKFWKFISKNTNFSQNLISLDIRLLTNFYKSIGYYDVKITSNTAEINDNEETALEETEVNNDLLHEGLTDETITNTSTSGRKTC